jgi:signal transduction histidine kinase
MPTSDAATLRNYGLDEKQIELFQALQVRSLMSVLLRARERVTGVLTFGSCRHNYDRDDLRFAETYAHQAGTLLENTRLHAEAQAALHARDEFLALAGHELRTPLTSLTYAVDLLRRGQVQRAGDVIERQTARLSRLVELVTCSSQEFSGQMPLRLERLDLAELVRGVAQDLSDLLAQAGCTVRMKADQPVAISGDRAGLEVAVSNLLTNAMKFGAGKPVEVTVDGTDKAATIVVRDHGIGIPVEQQGSVFERYERAVSSKHFGGLGLGLYITSKIVKAHGGDIRVDSRSGEGAVFTIELQKS